MSLTENTPDSGRRNSRSALDFVFWVLSNTQTTVPRSVASQPFIGAEKDEVASAQLVVRNAFLIGIDIPGSLDALHQRILEAGTYITPREAFRKRGALLFRNRGVAVSLGDGKRIVETLNDTYTVRHLLETEKADGFWSSAALLPGVRYL